MASTESVAPSQCVHREHADRPAASSFDAKTARPSSARIAVRLRSLAAMPARLLASAGWPDIVVDRALVVVGRHAHCDVRLISPRVSRWHCCLIESGGEIWVRDLGSTNGVWINGKRTTAGHLKPGDELSVAHISYVFCPVTTPDCDP
jgi:hypothetical protein